MEKIILHIDVNNAFLSWTALYLLENGAKFDIRNSYAAIGGSKESRNGIILAKSTPAKKMGVKSAETIYEAKKKCPALKIYSPNFSYYSKKSKQLFNLLSKYTPDIEVASIDECYIDFTKVKNIYHDPYQFSLKLQKEIYEELGFTVNVGIANSKLCAKMASDLEKPFKINTLYDNEIKEKMWKLPIEDLFGVGKSTSLKLKKLGIKTIKDLALFDLNILKKYFKNMALELHNKANGIDNSEVISGKIDPKGISMEITLEKDETNKETLLNILNSLTNAVCMKLRKEKKYARTICIITKTYDFKRKTHQKKLLNPTDETFIIYEEVKKLFLNNYDKIPIRLIGVRVSDFTDVKTIQTSLFSKIEEDKTNQKLDEVLDSLKKKYGYNIINNASSYNTKLNIKEK